jgi:hypothetical protein
MRINGIGIAAGFLALFLATGVGAADYQTWVPLLPETLGGLPRMDQPEGLNMDASGQSWSSLIQEYARQEADRFLSLTLVSGDAAPEAQMFQAMSQMTMETSDQVIRSLRVGEYPALLQLDKANLSGSLIISVGPHSLVILQGEPMTAEADLTALAGEIPLQKMAAVLK